MTVDEIIAKCKEQQTIGGEKASVMFLMPGRWGKRDTRRLWRGGPIGQIVDDNHDGRGLRVMFKAQEILDAIDALQVGEGVADG